MQSDGMVTVRIPNHLCNDEDVTEIRCLEAQVPFLITTLYCFECGHNIYGWFGGKMGGDA